MSSTNKHNNLKLGAILSYFAILINILSSLIYSPWMLSQIGDSDYGLYTLAMSLINLFLLDFGIGAAVTRFVSKYNAEGKQDEVNSLLSVVYKLFILISMLISVVLIVLFFFIDKIYVALTPNELAKFKVVYIIAAVFTVFSFPLSTTVNGILTSYEKFVQMKLCDVIHRILTVVLVVIAILLGQGLYAFVTITALTNLAMLLIKFIIIKITTKVKIKWKYFDRSLLKEIFGFSIWIIINSICSRLILNICPSILGITTGSLSITIFSFASTLDGYTYTFASAIDGMFMPKIARIVYKDKNIDELLGLMIKVGRYQFSLIGFIFVGFACVGKEFIMLWLGDEYVLVYWCALLLMASEPFYLSQQIGKNAMTMTNNVKYLTFINIVKAALNVVGVFVLSKFYGVLGACISICVVYFIRNVAYMVAYKKVLKFNIRKFYYECYLKLAFPLVITFSIGLVVNYFYTMSSWLHFLIKVIIMTAVFIIVMLVFGFNQSEKAAIKGFIKRRGKG